MSENKFLKTTRSVADVVDGMLTNGYKLSLGYNNSYYLYSYDKVPVFIASGYYNGKNECVESTLQTLNIPGIAGIHLDEDFSYYMYSKILYASNKIRFDAVNEKSLFSNLVKESKNKKYNKINKQDVIEHMVSYLIDEPRSPICPVDVIKRNLYFFDKPETKVQDCKGVSDVMKHNSRLVEYKTNRGNYWFFVGEKKSTGKFLPMDSESRQIFNAVKIALKNQKQNVK